MRKPAFCISETKDANQLRGNREADQRLCFRYSDSTIPLLPTSEFQVSSHLVWLYSLVCVRPGRKSLRPVFSQRGSYFLISQMDDVRDYILGPPYGTTPAAVLTIENIKMSSFKSNENIQRKRVDQKMLILKGQKVKHKLQFG